MGKRRDGDGVQHSTGSRRPKDEPSILDKAGYWQRWQDLKEFVAHEVWGSDISGAAEGEAMARRIENKMKALE